MGLKTPVLWAVLLTAGAVLAPLEAWAQVQEVVGATAETQAHSEAAAHSGGLPQFNFALWPGQLFWLTIFFVVLYRVFSSVILPEISGTLAARKAHIDGILEQAEHATFDAQKLEYDLEMARAHAAQLASDTLKQVEREAAQHLQEAMNSFRARYETEMEATEVRVRRAAAQAREDLDGHIAQITTAIFEKVTQMPANRHDIDAVVGQLNAGNSRDQAA